MAKIQVIKRSNGVGLNEVVYMLDGQIQTFIEIIGNLTQCYLPTRFETGKDRIHIKHFKFDRFGGAHVICAIDLPNEFEDSAEEIASLIKINAWKVNELFEQKYPVKEEIAEIDF